MKFDEKRGKFTVLHYDFFFNDTATTEIYTLSLHDALPILIHPDDVQELKARREEQIARIKAEIDEQEKASEPGQRLEELRKGLANLEKSDALAGVEIGRAHVELQSQSNLVCRLLLEKKKKK